MSLFLVCFQVICNPIAIEFIICINHLNVTQLSPQSVCSWDKFRKDVISHVENKFSSQQLAYCHWLGFGTYHTLLIAYHSNNDKRCSIDNSPYSIWWVSRCFFVFSLLFYMQFALLPSCSNTLVWFFSCLYSLLCSILSSPRVPRVSWLRFRELLPSVTFPFC